jgi:hypothetical protein
MCASFLLTLLLLMDEKTRGVERDIGRDIERERERERKQNKNKK